VRIAALSIELKCADSALAEFLVRVEFDSPVAGYEVRGRVVGPRCLGITTVEIAYPLVLLESSVTAAALRGVIPEPNLWSPDKPFLYEVTAEAWAGGRRTDKRTSMLALRSRLAK
jgi:hypothetical protein